MNAADVYGFAKDFAGPIATTVAATAAAFVTFFIQRQNYTLARKKHKLELFDKRYEVYCATRDLLILMIINSHLTTDEREEKFKALCTKMVESDFLCSKDASAFCKEVFDVYQRWLIANSKMKNIREFPLNDRAAIAEEWTRSISLPLEYQNRVAPAFTKDLSLTD